MLSGHLRFSWVARRVVATLLVVAAAVTAAVPRASAQAVGANVGGVVTDPSGARLPGVAVTGTNTANGATQAIVTGPEGKYRAVALQPRPHMIKAELPSLTAPNPSVVLTLRAAH